nr:MAG TPA: hypothetical protein [Caudoviricetes sp.]
MIRYNHVRCIYDNHLIAIIDIIKRIFKLCSFRA